MMGHKKKASASKSRMIMIVFVRYWASQYSIHTYTNTLLRLLNKYSRRIWWSKHFIVICHTCSSSSSSVTFISLIRKYNNYVRYLLFLSADNQIVSIHCLFSDSRGERKNEEVKHSTVSYVCMCFTADITNNEDDRSRKLTNIDKHQYSLIKPLVINDVIGKIKSLFQNQFSWNKTKNSIDSEIQFPLIHDAVGSISADKRSKHDLSFLFLMLSLPWLCRRHVFFCSTPPRHSMFFLSLYQLSLSSGSNG